MFILTVVDDFDVATAVVEVIVAVMTLFSL
jgi:hypothetical protein